MRPSCKACGGALNPEDERCGLCGTPAGVDPDELEYVELETSVAASDSRAEDVPRGEDGAPVFCNACGWKNPAGARFCSQCGEGLQALPSGTSPVARATVRPPGPAPQRPSSVEKGVGSRVAIIVGSAVLVVLALYLISALGTEQGAGPQPPQPIGSVEDVPLTPGIAAQVEALDDSLAIAGGTQRTEFLRQKVELLVGAGRYDLAGEAQEQVAAETAAEIDWAFAGNLYYDSMDRAPESSEARTRFAKAAIAAYRQALEINPDNLDVRTDMAVAYLYDPENPMSAIQETQEVLRRDSMHVQANFNRGIMLLQINRADQALEQFRKVQRIVGDPSDPIHQRAQQAIDTVTGQNR